MDQTTEMESRIADTSTESLGRLSGEEQRAAKTTAFDLQLNPAQPGMKFHRVDRARDRNFWSVRVNRGVRVIVHETAGNLLLCYVGEHDDAYRWAERRRLEQPPHTGTAQLVEIREVVRKIEIPRYVAAERAMFAGVPDSQLLNYGVPAEWLDDVKQVSDEDALLALADHLPPRRPRRCWNWPPAARLGGRSVEPPMKIRFPILMLNAASTSCPTRRSCAGRSNIRGRNGRSFCILRNGRWWNGATAVRRACQDLPEPARPRGAAPRDASGLAPFGRACAADHVLPGARGRATVRLIANEPKLAERLEVHAMADIGRRLYQAHFGQPDLATPDRVRELLRQAATEVDDLRSACASCGPSGAAWSMPGSLQAGNRSGPAAARSEDSPARTAAGAPLVSLLQGSRRARRARAPDRAASVRSPGAPAREDGTSAVRVLRG